jgi:hypothetical protein
MSLLNTDWYIDQQKRRAYESAPVPFSMSEQKYRQGTRDVVYIQTDEEKPGYMSLNQAMKFVQSDDKKDMLDFGSRFVNYFPNHRFYINVDSTKAEKFRGMMNEGDSLVRTIAFQITDERGRPRRYLTKSQMMILDLLNNLDWDRPVYFAVTTGSDTYMGLEQYFQLEGLAYRFTPILHKRATNPYVEASFSHSVAKQTYVRWYGRYGFEDADVGNSTERTSIRTGVSLQQRFTNRIAGNIGANYIHDEFDGGSRPFDDDIVEVSLGLDFNVYRNLVLNTGYSFTTTSSGVAEREYDRHILSLGMTARF